MGKPKLFISQPMRGKTDEEILAVRKKAIESAKRELGVEPEVIDSFFQGAPAEAKPLWFLGKSLELMSEAKCIDLLDNDVCRRINFYIWDMILC